MGKEVVRAYPVGMCIQIQVDENVKQYEYCINTQQKLKAVLSGEQISVLPLNQ